MKSKQIAAVCVVLLLTLKNSPAALIFEFSTFLNSSTVQSGTPYSGFEPFKSTTQTVSGATFRLLFDVTASAGTIALPSNDLGVVSSMGDTDEFNSALDEVTFNNFVVTDFDAGGSSLTSSDISVEMISMSFKAASAASDSGTINGVTWTDLGDPTVSIAGGPASSATLKHAGGIWRVDSVGFQATAVPEPSSFLLGGGLVMMLVFHRRRRVS